MLSCSKYQKRFLSDSDDCGWKIVHTDVFRFPPYKGTLCAILGRLCVSQRTFESWNIYMYI